MESSIIINSVEYFNLKQFLEKNFVNVNKVYLCFNCWKFISKAERKIHDKLEHEVLQPKNLKTINLFLGLVTKCRKWLETDAFKCPSGWKQIFSKISKDTKSLFIFI